MPTHHRRRFAFRLRTLFALVTALSIPLAWAAYQLAWMHQRHAYVVQQSMRLRALGVGLATYRPNNRTDVPGALWVFGESGVQGLWVVAFKGQRDQELRRAQQLFPEAKVTAVGEIDPRHKTTQEDLRVPAAASNGS